MTLEVLRAGLLSTIQDCGRPGFAHLGVPTSGAADHLSHELANRLVGNPLDAATIETTFSGCAVRLTAGRFVAVAGARAAVTVAGRAVADRRAVWVPAGAVLDVGTATTGLRSYVAVAGGLRVEAVFGSSSSDLLSGLGPPPLTDGTTVELGPAVRLPRFPDVAILPHLDRPAGPLRVIPGPRADWFTADALDRLAGAEFTVGVDSNRVGVRLDGPALPRSRDDELPSEGMRPGAVQVPPHGRPVIFLADAPTTGGYPVLGYLDRIGIARLAQGRPGDGVHFSCTGAGW